MVDTLIGELGCKNCRFAFRPAPGRLECRFNPPVPFPIGMTPQGPVFAAVFPCVDPTLKCSKHECGVVVGAVDAAA